MTTETETFQTELAEYLDGMIPLPAHWSPEQRAEAKRACRAANEAQRQHEMAGFLSGMRMVSEVSARVAEMGPEEDEEEAA
ncbi:hypothetical protein V5F77_02685 [Xanthobacter sp. DSM 24535]|uniref:hypothetical protein n=1 Tax=Roseixanthobacter psychrophilus TaxID=3119917 RepID=UPI00372BAA5C